MEEHHGYTTKQWSADIDSKIAWLSSISENVNTNWASSDFLNTNTTSSLCIDNSEISIDKLAEESNSKNQYENPQDEEFFDKFDIF